MQSHQANFRQIISLSGTAAETVGAILKF